MKVFVDGKGVTKAAADMKLAVFPGYVRGQVNILNSKEN